jgi:hypothetical protein
VALAKPVKPENLCPKLSEWAITQSIWMELPNKKDTHIISHFYAVEPLNEDNWQNNWD